MRGYVQRLYLAKVDRERLGTLAHAEGCRALGTLLRRLISEALIARQLDPLTTLVVGYPKGRKRR